MRRERPVGRHLSDAERAELYKALTEGGTATKVAQAFGVNQRTALAARRDLMRAGLEALQAQQREDAPEERHDSAFWRRRYNEAERRLDELHALVRELGGLDGIRVRRPTWAAEPPQGGKGSAVLLVHNSDRHLGEVIEPNEINGWNAYNVSICQARVRRLIAAALELGRRWTSDTVVDGVLYTMAGDEISGDIHDELRETNEATSLEQVQLAAELHVWCIGQLADEFGRVHVCAVPGNHGRTTRKPTAKKYGALSYDILIAKLVARAFADDDRVSFNIADGPDCIAVVHNRLVLVTHGDKTGTGGGQGFAGPVLPILRGGHKMRLQYASAGSSPYLVLQGHYHTSADLPGILANGSVPGYSEYGFGIRGQVDTPRQWLAVLRSGWGLSERLDVQLEKPPAPEKPRVRAAV